MMNRSLVLALLLSLSLASPALADPPVKPDDTVQMELAAENWVSTKTARVLLEVDAAVSAANASSMRKDMLKAVGDVAKADWRLTSFNRAQDKTGMEHWSVLYEARLPEDSLDSLSEAAKKRSKAGLQLSVSRVDFTPTLDEIEATQAKIRSQIYKSAQDQLTILNAAFPARHYRISSISFSSPSPLSQPRLMALRASANKMANMDGGEALGTASLSGGSGAMERSEKITMTAQLVFSAVPELSK